MATKAAPQSTTTGSSTITGKKKWKVVYPVYINSKKTIKEGRQIPKEKACENPTITEVFDTLKHLGFTVELEADKSYPRDFTQRGRVRVNIRKADESFVLEDVTSKHTLLLKLGSLIPRLSSRQNASTTSNTTQDTSSTKKNKKGRK